MASADLYETARAIVANDKGILAADESTGTIEKRFDAIGVESTEENRRAYRDLLFTTPGMEEFISGVILYDETIRQRSADGTPFAELLAAKGIIPGIKVDTGAKPLAAAPGRDGDRGPRRPARAARGVLRARRALRQVARRDHDRRRTSRPTPASEANAHALARYAALCQEAGLVPIVEPEVLMDGDHTIERVTASPGARCARSSPSSTPAGRSRGHAAEAQHGDCGARLPRTSARPTRSPRRRCTASRVTCPPPSRGSCSSRAASRTSRRPRT